MVIYATTPYFGEEVAIFNYPCIYRARAVEKTEILQIHGELIRELPVMRWELFDSCSKRTLELIYAEEDPDLFRWRSELGIHVLDMDVHHKRLVEISNCIIENIKISSDGVVLGNSLEQLLDYLRYHFAAEEGLMKQYGYPEVDRHQLCHAKVVEEVEVFERRVKSGNLPELKEFLSFLEGTLIHHFLEQDKKYSEFLHSKGIF